MAERTGSWWSSGVFRVLNLVDPSRTIVPSAPTAGSARPATRAPPTAAATISRTTTLALPRSLLSAINLGVRTDSGYARWLIWVATVISSPARGTARRPLSCGNYSSFRPGLLTVRGMAHVGYLRNGPNGV